MLRLFLMLLVISLFCEHHELIAGNNTQEQSLESSGAYHYSQSALKEGMALLGGVATGFLVHEAAHFAVLESKGYEYELEFPDQIYYQEGSESVQFAGFAAQGISTELILLKKERNSFLYGWLGWNTLNEIIYPLRSWVHSKEGGDLGTAVISTRRRNQVSVLLLLHAGFTIYRLDNDKDYNSYIQFFFDNPQEGTGLAYTRSF